MCFLCLENFLKTKGNYRFYNIDKFVISYDQIVNHSTRKHFHFINYNTRLKKNGRHEGSDKKNKHKKW